MPTALILDSDPGGHGTTVKSYFDAGAPSGWDSEVVGLTPSPGVDKAIDEGYALIIRSMKNVWADKAEWDRAWEAGIPVVHAHGSNDPDELPEPPRLFSAVVVGGEDPSDDDLERSWGPGLELDAQAHDGEHAESWATPTAAAVLARFYEAQDGGLSDTERWWNARSQLRMACAGYSDGWQEEEGYGVVQHDADPPSGVDLQPPVDVTVAVDGEEVTFEWLPFQTSDYAETVIEVNGAEVYSGADAEFTWQPSKSYEDAEVKLYSAGGGNTSTAHVPPSTLTVEAPSSPGGGGDPTPNPPEEEGESWAPAEQDAVLEIEIGRSDGVGHEVGDRVPITATVRNLEGEKVRRGLYSVEVRAYLPSGSYDKVPLKQTKPHVWEGAWHPGEHGPCEIAAQAAGDWVGRQSTGLLIHEGAPIWENEDVFPPAEVSDLEAELSGQNQPVLTWTDPTDTDFALIRIERDGVEIDTVQPGTETYTDTDTEGGKTYTYRVRTEDDKDNTSEGVVDKVTTLDLSKPGAITDLSGDLTEDNEPELTWSEVAGAAEYNIYRDGSLYDTIPAPAASYVDVGTQEETTYTYDVRAVSEAGIIADPSNEVQVTTEDRTAPDAPTGLSAETNADGEPELSWTPSASGDVEEQHIYRATGGQGDWARIDTVGAQAASYTDTSALTEEETYDYRVTAEDEAENESAPSNEVSVTIPDMTAPAAPTGLTAEVVGGDIVLGWDDNTEGDLDHYVIYRGTDPNPDQAHDTSTTSDYTDASVVEGVTYYYRVTAVDDAGNESDYSGEVSEVGPDVTAPTITNFSVSNPSGQDVEVSFDSDEALAVIEVAITGAETATLTEEDFTESAGTYAATYNGSSDGTYTATLNVAEDAAGNDGAGGESDSVTVDTAAAPSTSNYDTSDIELGSGGTWSADVAAGGDPGDLWWAIKGGTAQDPVYTDVTDKAAYDGSAITLNTGDEWSTLDTFEEEREWDFALLYDDGSGVQELAVITRSVVSTQNVPDAPTNLTMGAIPDAPTNLVLSEVTT